MRQGGTFRRPNGYGIQPLCNLVGAFPRFSVSVHGLALLCFSFRRRRHSRLGQRPNGPGNYPFYPINRAPRLEAAPPRFGRLCHHWHGRPFHGVRSGVPGGSESLAQAGNPIRLRQRCCIFLRCRLLSTWPSASHCQQCDDGRGGGGRGSGQGGRGCDKEDIQPCDTAVLTRPPPMALWPLQWEQEGTKPLCRRPTLPPLLHGRAARLPWRAHLSAANGPPRISGAPGASIVR